MIPEPYLGLIVGSTLTLIVSVVSIVLTNHYSEKQWIRQKKLEDHDRMVEQVYSPLYFILFDMEGKMGEIGGTLKAFLERGIFNENVQKDMIKWLQDCKKEERLSSVLRGILNTKLGLIKPYEFQSDLFYLFSALDSFETSLFDVDKATFATEEKLHLEKRFQNYLKLTGYYFHVLIYFVVFISSLISKETELSSDFKYKMIINEPVREKLRDLLRTPFDEKNEAEAERVIDDALKEISSLNQNRKQKGNAKT